MVTIGESRASDFKSLIPLLRQLWPDKPIDPAAVRRIFLDGIASGDHTFLSAYVEGTMIGFCSVARRKSLWQEGLIGNVDELVVDVEHRGMRVGVALLRRITQIAADEGWRRIELDSGFHRKDAHRFYDEMGFEKRAYLFSKRI
ncbi:MAG: GNAT family N-acetyltransferase [Planctomycetota bacterium]